jgi:hypothetical protein
MKFNMNTYDDAAHISWLPVQGMEPCACYVEYCGVKAIASVRYTSLNELQKPYWAPPAYMTLTIPVPDL